jgi:hypothetical protein
VGDVVSVSRPVSDRGRRPGPGLQKAKAERGKEFLFVAPPDLLKRLKNPKAAEIVKRKRATPKGRGPSGKSLFDSIDFGELD